MRAGKRAFLYLIRKRSKSILLLLILFTLTTLVLSSLSITKGASNAALELRRTLGGYMKLENQPDYAGKQQAITGSLIEKISKIDGVRHSNRMNTEYLLAPDLTLDAGKFTAEGDEKAHLARFLGNGDTSLHEYFFLRSFALAEGRHIGPGDRGKAIISQTLAQLNGLSVGDAITASLYEEDPSGGPAASSSYRWEVVGIFEDSSSSQNGSLIAECDMVNNFVFADIASMMQVQTDKNPGSYDKYRSATFFVDDPEQMDQIIQKAYALEGVNWESLALSVNNKAYQSAAFPLLKLGSYTRLFLYVIMGISVILLTLILTMWMRDRIQEIGVFLSMGMKKISLIGQHLLEVLIVLSLALAAAFPTASLIASGAGTMLLDNMPRQEEQQTESRYGMYSQPTGLSASPASGTIEASVGAKEFLWVALYGTAVSFAAVGISCAATIRMKPKDILSLL